MPTQEEQTAKELQNIQDIVIAHMRTLHPLDGSNFDDWLACTQALVQIRKLLRLQFICDMLSTWHENGVHVYPIANVIF